MEVIIYKIYQTELPDMIYIGSTNNFSKRKSNHKKSCYNKVSKKYKIPLYQYIRACGGWDKFTMEQIGKYPIKSKGEGLQKEKELIEFYNAKLNSIKPCKDM